MKHYLGKGALEVSGLILRIEIKTQFLVNTVKVTFFTLDSIRKKK